MREGAVVVEVNLPPVNSPPLVEGVARGEWRPEMIVYKLGDVCYRDLLGDMAPVPLECG